MGYASKHSEANGEGRTRSVEHRIVSHYHVSGDIFVQQRLTRSALFDLICSNCKSVEDLNHYCRD